MLNTVGILIDRKNFAPLAQQMNQVSSVSTAGVEYTHASGDVSSQDLVKYIDINVAELFLNF